MKPTLCATAAALLVSTALAQIPIPGHSSSYTGYSRGFNFTSNTNFVITQLDLPLDAYQAGDTASYMIRVNGVEVLRSVGNAGAIGASILISPGDVVDVIGNWSPAATGSFTAHNSYGSSAPYNTTIEGVAHVLNRMGWQWDIGDPAYMSGSPLTPGSGSIGRVFVYTSPASGLFPNFTATPLTGASPLAVQFTDSTYTSDPGGVTSWAWDFDNDGTIDSTAQNPNYTYTTGGKFTVSMTVTDATHGSANETKVDYIVVDPISGSFTASPTVGPAPLTVQFTDTTTGNPIGWNWDFDNDGTVDSILQNPVYTYTNAGRYTVVLQVTNGVFVDTVTQTDLITVVGATNNTQSPAILEFQFNEPRGASVANTASTTLAPSHGMVGDTSGTPNPAWQADPGRPLWMGNDPGSGCLGADNSSPYESRVDTGWPIDLVGSHTIMFWSRPVTVGTASTSYAFGAGSGTSGRCYYYSTGGYMSLRSWGNVGANVDSATDPKTLSGWSHWSVVIDDATGTAQWYVNGVADGSPTSFTPNTFTYQTGNFIIGSYSTTTSMFTRYFELDDFRVFGRALTPAQILQAMLFENPTTSTFADGCAGPGGVPQLGASGGAPTVAGNTLFAYEASNMEAGMPAALNLGLQQASNSFLPYDLSFIPGFSGCYAEVFPDIVALGLPNAAGSDSVPLAVPADPALAAFHIYGQVIVLGTQGAVSPCLDTNFK